MDRAQADQSVCMGDMASHIHLYPRGIWLFEDFRGGYGSGVDIAPREGQGDMAPREGAMARGREKWLHRRGLWHRGRGVRARGRGVIGFGGGW